MAEKIRRKVYRPVTGDDLRPAAETTPEIREEPAAVPVTGSDYDEAAKPAAAVVNTAPYAEFGGLERSAQDRRADAARRREEAMKEWERRLSEQNNARLALVDAAKPADTAKEQRKLRNLALGQAVGEFVGALFGGLHGLGSSSGRGYVAKMPGMYRNTLNRLRQLSDNDIIARERFRNQMGAILERNARDRAAMARERYRDVAAEEKQLRTEQDMIGREMARAGNRMEAYERQARDRADLQQQRHQQRLAEQRNAAVMKRIGKSSGSGNEEVDDDVAYLTKLLLPKTRTSTTSGGKFPTTTVRDATSYSKQEVAATTALAKRIAPVRKRYDLSDYDIGILQDAITAKPSAGVDWQQIADALAEGYSVDDIVLFIRSN